MSAEHLAICAKCGKELGHISHDPRFRGYVFNLHDFEPKQEAFAQARAGDTLPPPPMIIAGPVHDHRCISAEAALAAASYEPKTVIAECPHCGELSEHVVPMENFRCSHGCEKSWPCPPLRSAEELIAFIRKELESDHDASRRSFYNPSKVLFAIAEAVDLYPADREET